MPELIPERNDALKPQLTLRIAGICALGVWCAAMNAAATELAGAGGQTLKGLFHNEDNMNFFWFHPIPKGKAGEAIDQYVDVLADAGVNVLFCNINSRRTNYRSRVWDSYWDGYDPAGPDDQPFLAAMSRGEAQTYRKGVDKMLAVHNEGVDYPARVVERCRHDGISPWISLRMNDCHYNDNLSHPFHGKFWREHPDLCRKNCPGYFANCLDYAHPEVRDYFKALVLETLDRYDVDGLELDFMRECYLFSAGQELKGAAILTNWMRGIRKLVDDAATRRGHPVYLGVRVPSRPEVALALGLEVVKWAEEELVDLIDVTPRWATIEFDMPIQEWRKRLAKSKVALAGGLEINYRPYPDAPKSMASPELAVGAAALVLAQGADAVYLFNYFQDTSWPLSDYQKTLKTMGSLDSLLKQRRSVGITYRDVTAPTEKYLAPLPVTGKQIVLPLKLGPVSENASSCELLLGLVASSSPVPVVSVNGKPCGVLRETAKDGSRLISFHVPTAAIMNTEVQKIKVASNDEKALTVQRVEMSLNESVH